VKTLEGGGEKRWMNRLRVRIATYFNMATGCVALAISAQQSGAVAFSSAQRPLPLRLRLLVKWPLPLQ
jgi:hypothetical protein